MSDVIDSTSNLESIPVQNIEVKAVSVQTQDRMKTEEFTKELIAELKDGKASWRTSTNLAKKLNVDVVELDKLIRAKQEIICRPSKDEGVFLYALVKRVEVSTSAETTAATTEVDKALRTLVSEEDRYAVAMIHSSWMILTSALNKFGVKMYERNKDAFTNLVEGKNKIEAGLVLLAKSTKSDLDKLPMVKN